MRRPRTAQAIEHHYVIGWEFPHTCGPAFSVITGFHDPPGDLKRSAAILDHLRHEWEAVQRSVNVQRLQNLFWTPYLHNIAGS
jgi:hypothetical protein